MNEFRSIWPDWKEEKLYAALVAAVLFAAFLYLLSSMILTTRQSSTVGVAPIPPRTISVMGEGKVTATPDVASIDLGVTAQKPSETEAVTEVTNKMNALLAKLREMGIADADLQAQQYSVYPRYDYPDGRQVATGYEATQQVEVTLRDLKQLPKVIQSGTELGANQIGDLRHEIDDPEPYREQARMRAAVNARQKAEAMAKAVGVRLGGIVSFDESSSVGTPPYPIYAKEAYGLGAGGGGIPAPDVPAGSQDIVSYVTLTFQLR